MKWNEFIGKQLKFPWIFFSQIHEVFSQGDLRIQLFNISAFDRFCVHNSHNHKCVESFKIIFNKKLWTKNIIHKIFGFKNGWSTKCILSISNSKNRTSPSFIARILLFFIHSLLICLDNLTCTFYNFSVHIRYVLVKWSFERENKHKIRTHGSMARQALAVAVTVHVQYEWLRWCYLRNNISIHHFENTSCPNLSWFYDFHVEAKTKSCWKLEILMLHIYTFTSASFILFWIVSFHRRDKRLKVTIGFLFISFFRIISPASVSYLFWCVYLWNMYSILSQHYCWIFSSIIQIYSNVLRGTGSWMIRIASNIWNVSCYRLTVFFVAIVSSVIQNVDLPRFQIQSIGPRYMLQNVYRHN